MSGSAPALASVTVTDLELGPHLGRLGGRPGVLDPVLEYPQHAAKLLERARLVVHLDSERAVGALGDLGHGRCRVL